jgi:uncharacterized membrane protein YeaQ/YmgE (transglycosylase-associated protein family)
MGAIGDLISSIISAPFACIGWIIVGFIAGALARRIMGSGNAGCVSDIVLGLIGAFLGGIVVSWLGIGRNLDIGLGIGSVITALIGAVILIAIGRIFSPRRRR